MASAFVLEDRPHVGPARFTADEFLRMEALGAFEGRKVELANGEIVEEPLPLLPHAELQALIIHLLTTAVPRTLATVAGEVTLRLSGSTVRDADAALVKAGAPRDRALRPADLLLAVEIAVTTLAVDLNDKAAEYAAAGIPTYWVVDAAAEVVHAMSGPGPQGYAQRRVVRFTEPLATPGGEAITIA